MDLVFLGAQTDLSQTKLEVNWTILLDRRENHGPYFESKPSNPLSAKPADYPCQGSRCMLLAVAASCSEKPVGCGNLKTPRPTKKETSISTVFTYGLLLCAGPTKSNLEGLKELDKLDK